MQGNPELIFLKYDCFVCKSVSHSAQPQENMRNFNQLSINQLLPSDINQAGKLMYRYSPGDDYTCCFKRFGVTCSCYQG